MGGHRRRPITRRVPTIIEIDRCWRAGQGDRPAVCLPVGTGRTRKADTRADAGDTGADSVRLRRRAPLIDCCCGQRVCGRSVGVPPVIQTCAEPGERLRQLCPSPEIGRRARNKRPAGSDKRKQGPLIARITSPSSPADPTPVGSERSGRAPNRWQSMKARSLRAWPLLRRRRV